MLGNGAHVCNCYLFFGVDLYVGNVGVGWTCVELLSLDGDEYSFISETLVVFNSPDFEVMKINYFKLIAIIIINFIYGLEVSINCFQVHVDFFQVHGDYFQDHGDFFQLYSNFF